MNTIKDLLRQPIKKSAIFLGVALVPYIALYIINYFTDKMDREVTIFGGDFKVGPGDAAIDFLQTVATDFITVNRIIVALAFGVLLAQVIYFYASKSHGRRFWFNK